MGEVVNDMSFGCILLSIVWRDYHSKGLIQNACMEHVKHEVDFVERVNEVEKHHYEIEAHSAPEADYLLCVTRAVGRHHLHHLKTLDAANLCSVFSRWLFFATGYEYHIGC